MLSAVSEQDAGFFFSSVKLAIFLRSLRVLFPSFSQLCVLLLVLLCISPCLSCAMPDEANSEHLDALVEEKLRIVLEEKLKATFEDTFDRHLIDSHLNWKSQVCYISKKIKRNITLLYIHF